MTRRFLLVTLNAAGNWPPERGLIGALARRGHDVRVLTDAAFASDVVDAGAEYRPFRSAPQRTPGVLPGDPDEPEMVKVMRNVYLNESYADELLAEVEADPPDILLVDQMLMTAISAAQTTQLPTATLYHTVYGASANMPWRPSPLLEGLNAYRGKLGLAPMAAVRYLFEGTDAVLVFTYEAFDEPPTDRPAHLHYVGPFVWTRPDARPDEFARSRNDRRPFVLVSYSTSFQNQHDVLQRVADAVAPLDARVLFTLGDAVKAGDLRLPANVTAETFVPHAEVLPMTDLVVTHAGHGTVVAALTAGVPVLCTPMGRDQFLVAGRLETLGLGSVRSMDATAGELRLAIESMFSDTDLRTRVKAFSSAVDAEAGRQRAVEVLEKL